MNEKADTIKGNEELNKIIDLLKSGDEKIKMPSSDDIVFLIGNTGSGKSTMAQFIGGNNPNLTSVETNPDSHEYIIVDEDNKISSNSTIISQTIFPELTVNSESATLFCDCPGFSDTRSAAHDIAATYFTKKVIDFAKRVKLVFLVNYPAVRKGVDRREFMELVQHVTTFIKGIEKFRDCLALLVTKVDNQVYKTKTGFELIPDEVVITGIGEFLLEVKHSLREMEESQNNISYSKLFYRNSQKLIDALLEKDETRYKRIGIFRRPDEEGMLSNITLIQNGKTILENMIKENLNFIDKCESDFGYTISAESLNYVNDLGKLLDDCIKVEIEEICGNIIKHFQASEELSQDIYTLEEKLSNILNLFTRYESDISSHHAGYIKDIILGCSDLDIDMFNTNLQNIDYYEKHLKFLQYVSGKLEVNPLKWMKGLTEMMKYLKESVKWYCFLITLYTWLSDYSIQKDILQFGVSQVIEQCSNRQNSVITLENLSGFSELIELIKTKLNDDQSLQIAFKGVKGITLNKGKLVFLKTVLSLTLNHNVSINQPTVGEYIFEGEFIRISEISKISRNNLSCVKVVATNKLFIDEDFDSNGMEVQIYFVSPVWEVIGKRKIILDGKPGASHKRPPQTSQDGMPGNPGEPAGNFFGVAGIVLGDYLKISAKGGKGGPGQDGGRGADGIRGRNGPSPKELNISYDSSWENKDVDSEKEGFRYTIKKRTDISLGIIRASLFTYEGYGSSASDGGPGGDGGVAGKGGHGGNIIIHCSENGKITTHTHSGEDGEDGKGGEGGSAAENGKVFHAETKREEIMFIEIPIEKKWTGIRNENDGMSKAGEHGITGANSRGQEDPKRGRDLIDSLEFINEYKNVAREKAINGIGDKTLLDFLNKLERIK